ncbi:MAG: hypothetical protein ACE5NA_05425 [Nitrospiraceae bacterium]
MIRLIWGLALFLMVLPAPGWAETALGQMECVSVEVNGSDVSSQQWVTDQQLQKKLVHGLQTGMNGLRVQNPCPDKLGLTATIGFAGTGSTTRYVATLHMWVSRMALVTRTKDLAPVIVWQDLKLFSGPTDVAEARVHENLGKLISEFAAAYQEAGNP